MSGIFDGLEVFGMKEVTDIELFVDKEKQKEKSLTEEEKRALEKKSAIVSKKYTCRICQKPFECWDVSVYKVKLEKSDTDLRNYFSPVEPLYYSVVICPNCGYGALRNYFDKVNGKQAGLIKKKISPVYKHKVYNKELTVEDSIERHRYALLNAAVKESKNSEQALICLQLSWLFRELGDLQNEILFRENALKGFSLAYEKEAFPIAGMDNPTLQYLIGELNRRCGNLDEALRYISRVVVSKGISTRLKNRALDIKDIIISDRKRLSSK